MSDWKSAAADDPGDNWASLSERGVQAVIPPRKHRKTQIGYDAEIYKWHHLVENYFANINLTAILMLVSD